MEYTQSIGDMFETYTGTPEEIAKLITLTEETEIISEDDLINYIDRQLYIYDIRIGKKSIQKILDLEIEYLKSKGMAE